MSNYKAQIMMFTLELVFCELFYYFDSWKSQLLLLRMVGLSLNDGDNDNDNDINDLQ